jgi:hypothetical protein
VDAMSSGAAPAVEDMALELGERAVRGIRPGVWGAIIAGVAVAVGLLAGAAAALQLDQRGHPKTVGVISLLGDQVSLAYTALLMGSFKEKVPVAGIGFDALAEATAMQCATAINPQLAFRKIDVPKAPLIEKLHDGLLAAYNATPSELRLTIFQWAKSHPVDVIVVIRDVFVQVPGGPSQYFGGVGVHQFVNKKAIIQATLGLSVWDGQTFDGITERSAIPIAGTYPGTVEQLRDEFKAGHRNPTFEQVLKRLVEVGVCSMMKGADL